MFDTVIYPPVNVYSLLLKMAIERGTFTHEKLWFSRVMSRLPEGYPIKSHDNPIKSPLNPTIILLNPIKSPLNPH